MKLVSKLYWNLKNGLNYKFALMKIVLINNKNFNFILVDLKSGKQVYFESIGFECARKLNLDLVNLFYCYTTSFGIS